MRQPLNNIRLKLRDYDHDLTRRTFYLEVVGEKVMAYRTRLDIDNDEPVYDAALTVRLAPEATA